MRSAGQGRGVAAAAVAVAAVLLTAGPATAEQPTPAPSIVPTTAPSSAPSVTATRSSAPTPAPSSPPATSTRPATGTPPGVESTPEPEKPHPVTRVDLTRQIAEADRLSALLERSNSRVAAETRAMDALSARSNALLERLAEARDVELAAADDADRARTELAAVEQRLARTRAVLRDWVFSVYSGGGSDVEISGMLDAMAAPADEVGNPMGDLAYLTEQRTRALADVRALTAEQVRLTAAAERSATSATQARSSIEKDKAALDALMVQQRARIGDLRKLQMAEVEQAGPIASMLVGARTARARAAVARLQAALTATAIETATVGKPCSDDAGVHPNGLFPQSALCPLWQAPGERLAPGAAAAFDALSQAYAAQTGAPLCVTDSYRSLAEQYSVKATHGRFAATPGTSRHGLGRALDLCGGVQDFSSPAHRWMKVNAPLYGWFHPSWAAAGGALPEPWHWEYAGG